ncbi:phage holin family protein [Isoptericola haloaureus]|uniref:Phage holin family protein n=1 Tax=Isoptericola haloaureus TaxID=1542902 RepID=A0ABU7Z9W5_9MICO
MTDWDDGQAPPAERPPSVGRLVEQISEQATRLVRAEIALAKAEAAEKAKRSGIGVGLIIGALVVVLYALGVFVTTAILGLNEALDNPWLSALLVGLALMLLAGAFAGIAVAQLKQASRRPETIDRVKEDVTTVKEGMKR